MYRRPLRRACLLACALTAVPLSPATAAPAARMRSAVPLDLVFGPYFGTDAQRLYNSAQSA